MNGTALEKKEIERIYLSVAIEAQKQVISNWEQRKKRIIVIAGPTACGKTAFALQLAQKMNGEIISADSMQVYRNMDIGTAKATKEQQALVPHHLINTRHVTEIFNVVDFYYEARNLCQSILARNSTPIVVGGAGFYLHTFLYGPPSGPPSVPEVRKTLEEEWDRCGGEALYQRLKHADPQYANSVTKKDKQKIIRALEIFTLTGKKISTLSWKGEKTPQSYDFHCWFLYRPKEQLYQLIDQRCEKMLSMGFLDEVEQLEKEGLRSNPSASQAIGYRQALDFLKTERTPADYQRFLELFKQASRHYAKRQFTWFRREPIFRWLDLDLHDSELVMDIVERDYNAR